MYNRPRDAVKVVCNKSAFSYLRTLKTWHYPHLLLRGVLRPRAAAALAMQQSINIFYPPDPQQQTRLTLLQRDGQTDVGVLCGRCLSMRVNAQRRL